MAHNVPKVTVLELIDNVGESMLRTLKAHQLEEAELSVVKNYLNYLKSRVKGLEEV